jgi:alkylation response protein AidB-like acyl-CoA dehydrogenase
MNLALTDEQHFLRDTFSSLFAKEAPPTRVRNTELIGYDSALWALLIETGALGVGVSEDFDGGGGGLLELALIAEEAGRRLAPVPFPETAAAARLLAACGVRDLLHDALSGAKLVSLSTGSGPVERQLLTDGAVADIVLGFQGDQIVAVHRPSDVRPVSNMGGLPMARWGSAIDVDVLAKGDRLGPAFAAALDDVRILRSAALNGLAGEAIEIGAAYARERKAFGVSIGTYQAVAHPLADMLVARDGAQLLTWKACWASAEQLPRASSLAAMAYAFSAETAYTASQHSLHIHGGYGFTVECDIQLYYRRAKAWVTAFADPDRELDVIADRTFGAPGSARKPARAGHQRA